MLLARIVIISITLLPDNHIALMYNNQYIIPQRTVFLPLGD